MTNHKIMVRSCRFGTVARAGVFTAAVVLAAAACGSSAKKAATAAAPTTSSTTASSAAPSTSRAVERRGRRVKRFEGGPGESHGGRAVKLHSRAWPKVHRESLSSDRTVIPFTTGRPIRARRARVPARARRAGRRSQPRIRRGDPAIDESKVATANGQVANQVSYFGHLLYYFSGDTAPGQTNGVGKPNWFLLGPVGNQMTPVNPG